MPLHSSTDPMEFNAKLRQNIASQDQQPMSLSESDQNCLKPFIMKDELVPFDTTPSISKVCYNYSLQHFDHNLEHHQIHVNGSSSNPVFGIQTACYYDPSDVFPYGCSSNASSVDHFHEFKAFADHVNVGHGQVMDNFMPQRHSSISDDVMMGSDNNNNNNNNVGYHMPPPFDFQAMKPMPLVVPDEVSCVTVHQKVGMNKNRVVLDASARKTWKARKKSNVVKGQWTSDEDRVLIQLVEQYGVKKWCLIAQMLPGRIGKQCRERWHNHLRPDIKKDTWSEEEDKVLIQAHMEIGNKWAEIAKRLPGRTENSIKNHWNATKRRQFSKRKCRSKYPRGSILQEYIKSLNLDQSLSSSSSSTRYKEKPCSNNNATNTKPSSNSLPQALSFCPTDHLVPDYDFNEVPDFSFDEKLLQESCSIDSLLDEMPTAPNIALDAEKLSFHVDMAPAELGTEVKKELDLVEMMSDHQANI